MDPTAIAAIGVGGIDNDADDDEGDENGEEEPKQDSLEFVDPEVLQDDDAQEKTAEKAASMRHVTDLTKSKR